MTSRLMTHDEFEVFDASRKSAVRLEFSPRRLRNLTSLDEFFELVDREMKRSPDPTALHQVDWPSHLIDQVVVLAERQQKEALGRRGSEVNTEDVIDYDDLNGITPAIGIMGAAAVGSSMCSDGGKESPALEKRSSRRSINKLIGGVAAGGLGLAVFGVRRTTVIAADCPSQTNPTCGYNCTISSVTSCTSGYPCNANLRKNCTIRYTPYCLTKYYQCAYVCGPAFYQNTCCSC